MRRTPAVAGVHSGVPSSPPHDEELGASPFSDPSAHHGRASATPRRSSVDVALVGNPPGASSRPPDVDRDKAGGVTTTLEASVNLANCIMGAGALSLPAFFRSCGVLLGVALLLVSCAWTWFSAVMMLKAADVVSARQLRGAPIASYEELMDLTLGARGKAASTVGILLLQVGCLVGYANILADVVSPFAVDILPPGLEPSRAAFIAAVTLGGMLPVGVLVGGDGGSPLLAAVSQFSIAVVGLFASAMVAHALAPAHYGGSAAAQGSGSTTPTVTATGGSVPPIVWANFAGAMSVLPLAIFAFGAHPAVLPVVRSMKPWGLRPSTDVVTNVLKACAVGYLMIGLGGYLSFRSATAGNVLRNLDGQFLGSFGSKAIKFGYGLVILASVPTILLPLQKSARDAYLAMVAAGVIGNRRTKSVGQKTRTSPATDAEREKFLGGGGGGGGVVRSGDDDVSPELAARISHVVAFGSMLAALFLSLYVPNVAFAFGLTGSTCSFLIAFVLPAMAYLSVTAAGPRAPRTRARGAKLETDPTVEMTAASVGANANRDEDGDGDGEEILGGGGAAGVSITGASNRRGGGGGGGGASSGWEWFADDDWGDDDDGWHSGGGTPPGGSPRSPVSRARAAPTPTTKAKTASASASAPFAHRSDRASTRRWRLGARAQIVVATFLSVVCTQEVIREMLHEKKLVEVVAKIADAKVESDKIAAETKDISDAAAAFSASSAELEGAVAEATERINDAGAAAAAREKDEGGSREGRARADPADLDDVTKALADQLEAAMRAKYGEGERDDATAAVHDDVKVDDAKVDDAKPAAKSPAAFVKAPAGEPSPEASSSRVDAPAPPFPSPPLSDVDHHPVIPASVAVASTSDPAAVGPSDGTDPSEEEDASAAAAESIKKVEVAVANATKAKAALEDALGLHDDDDEDEDEDDASASAAAADDDDDDADGASATADTPADRSSGASRDRATGKNRSDATADAVRNEELAVSSGDVEGSDEDVVAAAEEKINALADAKAKVEEEASKELEKAVVEGVDEDLAKSLADMLPNITRG